MITTTTSSVASFAGSDGPWPDKSNADTTFFTRAFVYPADRQHLRDHLNDVFRFVDMTLGDLRDGLRGVTKCWSAEQTCFADPRLLTALAPETEHPTASDASRHHALAAFERIRDLLTLDDQRTAALARISRNTPRDWRNGNRPKGSTTRRLFELASVIDVVATQEPDMTVWARQPCPAGVSWLELASTDDGPRAVLQFYRSALFNRRAPSGLELDDEGTAPAASTEQVPASVRRKPGARRQPR